jgi:DNA repair exonuclease SbcCD ATPase subunit
VYWTEILSGKHFFPNFGCQYVVTGSNRVEGRGTATIHDVTISKIVPPPIATTSAALTSLLAQQKQSEKALARAQKSLTSLETYLESVNSAHVNVSKLEDVVHHYDATAEELDNKVTKLEEQLEELKTAMKAEQAKLSGPTGNEKLDLRARISVFADFEGEVKIALIYGAYN